MDKYQILKVLEDNDIERDKFLNLSKECDLLKAQRDEGNKTIVDLITKISSHKEVSKKDIYELIKVRSCINDVSYELDLKHAELVNVNREHARAMQEAIDLIGKDSYDFTDFASFVTNQKTFFRNVESNDGCDRAKEILIYEFVSNFLRKMEF